MQEKTCTVANLENAVENLENAVEGDSLSEKRKRENDETEEVVEGTAEAFIDEKRILHCKKSMKMHEQKLRV